MVQGIVIEGLVYGIMALAVFITFRVLDFADMTVDGSFPLGGAVMAVLLTAGVNPFLAIAVAFLAGCGAGAITAVIHSKLKIPGLLAGILTMTILYSVNLRVLGNRANLSLLKAHTLFDSIREIAKPYMSGDIAILLFLIASVAIILVIVDIFFHTDFGVTLGALGSNPQMITSQAMNPEVLKLVGICVSNGLVGIAGSLRLHVSGLRGRQLRHGHRRRGPRLGDDRRIPHEAPTGSKCSRSASCSARFSIAQSCTRAEHTAMSFI